MLTIRYAIMEDYINFKELNQEYFSAYIYNKYSETKEFIRLIDNESLIFLVENESIIGYAVIEGYEDMSCKILRFFIKKEMQRQGKGSKFVELIKSLAYSEGFKKIQLFSANMDTDFFWTKCRFKSINNSDLYECELN